MKKSTKKLLFFSSAALLGMYAYNRFVEETATKKNMLPTEDGAYFQWNQGNIFYTKSGKGKPVFLLHDTNPESSSIEWSKIRKKLQKTNTVYTIDLLGCGLSDKPGISYTSYLYVQLINSFIREVIKEKADIVASNMTAPSVIMANHMNPEMIGKMIFINPAPMNLLDLTPTTTSKTKQILINLPLVGTFIYNVMMNPKFIDKKFREIYYEKQHLISSKTEDAYYEAAHIDNSKGKYLYSSLIGRYMNTNIRRAVKKLDKPIYLICSREIKNNTKTIEEYCKYNSNTEVTYISNCKLYPQLENPDKTYQIIASILQKNE